MIKIQTYHDLKDLPKSGFFERLLAYPHITATYEMSKYMSRANGFDFSCKKVCCFSELLGRLVQNWKSQTDRMERSALARRFFRLKISAEQDSKMREWLIYCRRRSSDFVSAITLLTEAHLGPNDVPGTAPELELLVELWQYLIDSGDSIGTINNVLESQLDIIDNGKTKIELSLTEIFGPIKHKTVVLNGFYFITPIQRRVFDIIEKAGFDLIFLINYDLSYPYANQIWEATYSEEFGFPPMDEWMKDDRTVFNPMGEIFQGHRIDINNVRILKHESVIDLVRSISLGILDKHRIYSPDHEMTDEILKKFFSNEYGQMSLVSYPIGQFVSAIHNMWSDDTESLCLHIEDVKKCFVSGWLNHGQYNSKQCMLDLERLEPYFEGCLKIEDWINRLEALHFARTNVTPIFNEDSSDRWERMMSNPFTTIAALSIASEMVESISSMIMQIIDMAQRLFLQGAVKISDHLKQIDKILEELVESPDMEDEYVMMHEFLNRIDHPNGSKEYDACDLKEALDIFLGERPERAEDYGVREVVHPIRDVEVARLQNCKVHLILCDMNRMPGSPSKYLWPLSKKVIKSIYDSSDPYRKKLLEHLTNVMVSSPLSKRYLFYDAFKNDDVTVSWVNILDDKVQQPSPFINLLSQLLNVKVEDASHNYISMNRILEISPIDMSLGEFDITAEGISIPNEAKRDYALCPLRFLYGYLLSDHPVFSSKFHMQFVLARVISAVNSLCPEHKDYFTKQIMDLFPNMSLVERRQILDHVRDSKEIGYDTFNGREYTNLRNDLYFPTETIINLANEKFSDLYSNNGRMNLEIVDPPEDRVTCMYCPHGNYCRRALFSVDQDDVSNGKK